jgi:hypothetical protein
LVCGAHRTGTTWVGKMLAAGGETTYISEPLNVWHRRGVFRPDVKYWYLYINPENETDYLAGMWETLNYQYHPWLELVSLRSIKDLLRMGRDWANFLRGEIGNLRPLIKDPFAVFSLPWFIERFGSRVVVSIRHPAGFVSSIKRLGWDFNFDDLLDQPLLMHDWLEPYRTEMETARKEPVDVVVQGSLLWRMVYDVVWQYMDTYPDLLVVRHEDQSLAPLERFKALYDKLGLTFNTLAEKTILNSSGKENPVEVSTNKVHSVKLDSLSNLSNWKRRLTPSEIDLIHKLTQDVAVNYYSDDAWN